MALPKIDLPIFEASLPSTNEKIKYRPFTVKEEKILLIAQESKELTQIVNAIKQIVSNCLLDKDIEKLAVFDIEYMLLTLRAKSVDSMAKFTIDDPDTKEKINLELDLNNIKIHREKEHSNKIELNDDYTLIMRYPTIDEFMLLFDETKNKTEKNYSIMIACLDMLASKEEVYKFKDFTDIEIQEFIDSLETSSTKKIKDFFDTLPKIRHEMKYKNSKGEDKVFVIQGTQTFFI